MPKPSEYFRSTSGVSNPGSAVRETNRRSSRAGSSFWSAASSRLIAMHGPAQRGEVVVARRQFLLERGQFTAHRHARAGTAGEDDLGQPDFAEERIAGDGVTVLVGERERRDLAQDGERAALLPAFAHVADRDDGDHQRDATPDEPRDEARSR